MRAIDCGSAAGIAIGSLVKAFHQVSRLLKLNREEESCRHIDTFSVDAHRVGAAGIYFVGPVGQATGVGLPIQKIGIVLPYKKIRLIDWIGRAATAVGQAT